MRIWVDLPLNKPLLRRGNIINPEGGKTWVTFKYKRLLSFCFHCGILGHDEKHYTRFPYNIDSPKQYGDWLKVGGNSKGSSERSRASSSGSFDDDRSGRSGERSAPVTANSMNLEPD